MKPGDTVTASVVRGTFELLKPIQFPDLGTCWLLQRREAPRLVYTLHVKCLTPVEQ